MPNKKKEKNIIEEVGSCAFLAWVILEIWDFIKFIFKVIFYIFVVITTMFKCIFKKKNPNNIEVKTTKED